MKGKLCPGRVQEHFAIVPLLYDTVCRAILTTLADTCTSATHTVVVCPQMQLAVGWPASDTRVSRPTGLASASDSGAVHA